MSDVASTWHQMSSLDLHMKILIDMLHVHVASRLQERRGPKHEKSLSRHAYIMVSLCDKSHDNNTKLSLMQIRRKRNTILALNTSCSPGWRLPLIAPDRGGVAHVFPSWPGHWNCYQPCSVLTVYKTILKKKLLPTIFPRPGQNGDDFMGMGGGTPGSTVHPQYHCVCAS